MGIILRQSFKQSVVRFVGIGIGLISTLFIYPLALEEIGLVRFLQNTAQIILPFCLLGSQAVAVRFFPYFKSDQPGHNGFLSILFLWALFGFGIFGLLYLVGETTFLSFFSGTPTNYLAYFDYILPLVFLMVFSHLITHYTSNFHRIVVPSIFNELVLKITLPLLVLCFFWEFISLTYVVWGLVGTYLLSLIGLVLYLLWLGEFKLIWRPNFLSRDKIKEIGNFATYNVLGSWGYILANRIDVLMIGMLLSSDARFTKVGVYTINMFISEVIDAPRKSLLSISAPIVAEAAKKEDRAHLLDLYQKSSLNQLLIGLGLFLLIWVSLDDLFSIMPNGEEVRTGKWIVLLLGLGKLVDMATGVNGQIIQYSKYFRYSFYFTIVLAVVNILNNIWLIPMFDFTGAAIATLISITIYNICKVLLLAIKLKLQPFSFSNLLVLCIGLGAYGIGWLIPSLGEGILGGFLSVGLRSVAVGGFYFGLAYWLKVSPDLNEAIEGLLVNLRSRFK